MIKLKQYYNILISQEHDNYTLFSIVQAYSCNGQWKGKEADMIDWRMKNIW